MLTVQIEPASLCLGALLSGLPLLLWLWLQHRHAAQTQRALQTLQQANEGAGSRQAAELNEARADATRRMDELQAKHSQQQEEAEADHQRQLAQLKDEHARALDEVRREISVVSFPFEDTKGDDGWVVDDRAAEVGYQYQMFIRGLPCFEPHRVVLHRLSKREVNREKLEDLNKRVVNLLETVASQHPAIQVTKKVLSR